MLGVVAHKLWQDYLVAEKNCIHDVTMPALEAFIDVVLHQNQQAWQSWAQDLAIQITDGKSEIPVRLPLFRQVLLPALAQGLLNGTPGCARALAEFQSLLLKTQEIQLPDNLRTRKALLQEALRQNPADQLARDRLMRQCASTLEYAVHELPEGILFEHEFATLDECDKLLILLEEFKTHLEILNRTEQFSDLIIECELHFKSYHQYLLDGWLKGTYEQFFEIHL